MAVFVGASLLSAIAPLAASGQRSAETATAGEGRARPTLVGGYTLAEPRARVSARITRAIEAATEDMSFILRGMARGRIAEYNPVIRDLRVAHADGQIALSLDGRTLRSDDAGGRTAVTMPGGEQAQLSFRLRADRLVQTFEFDDGTRTHTFSLRRDGTLVMSVTLDAGPLPEPVRYRVTYRRSRD